MARTNVEIKPIFKDSREDLERAVSLRTFFVNNQDPKRHSISPEYYHWLYFQNPVSGSSFWAAYHDGQIVGMSTVISRSLEIFGKKIQIGEDAAGFVHPSYQGRGIRKSLFNANMQNAAQEGITTIFGISRTRQIHKAYEKAHFLEIPALRLKCLIRPVRLREWLKAKTHWNMAPLAGEFMMGRFYNRVFKKPSAARSGAVSIRREDQISSEFDDFYLSCSKSYDFIQVRDRQYLDWRYFKGPDPYELFTLRRNSGIVGYFVISRIPWRNMWIGNVVDFLTSQDDSRVVDSMISRAVFELQKRGVDFIQVWAVKGSPYYPMFLRYGFIPFRKIKVLFNPSALVKSLIDKNPVVHFTAGDSDYL